MTLGTRIRIALALAALAPVVLLGGLSVRAARQELTATVGGSLARQAAGLARECEQYTLDRLRGLQQTASYIRFDGVPRAEATTLLAIPYNQSPELQALALLGPDGASQAEPFYEPDPARIPGLAGHEPVDQAGLEAFGRAVPLEAARQAGLAIGPVHRAPGQPAPRVALAVRTGGAGDRILAAELSLADLAVRLRQAAGDGAALLVDGAGLRMASSDEAEVSADERALLADGAELRGPVIREVVRADGRAWLAGFAPVGSLGWGVLVAQPADEAFKAAGRVQRQTALWAAIALALAIGLGAVLSGALTRPVRRLTAAASALTEGRFDAPLPPAGRDELGTLAGAFAHMTAEVGRRDAEIRGWNAELRARVEQKSAELKAAEDQIARARRLSALSSLSAGVAAGLNDPLTSVVGLVSLAQREAGPGTVLDSRLGLALDEARKVARVVRDLRRLAAPGRAEGARRFQLSQPVVAAVEPFRPQLEASGIELALDLPAGLPPMEGDPEQIEGLVRKLVENALAAMAGGGRLTVSTRSVDGVALRLDVADTGRGIPAALRDKIFDPFFASGPGAGAGMGLTLAHGIVEAHHGRLSVESEPGRGSTFTAHFPAAPAAGAATVAAVAPATPRAAEEAR